MQGLDQMLWNAAQPESAHEYRGAVRNERDDVGGVLRYFVHDQGTSTGSARTDTLDAAQPAVGVDNVTLAFSRMREALIISAARLPTGKFLGSLKEFSAPELGARAVRAAVTRAGIDPSIVDECIMGNVLSAGLGQNPARQAALHGGLSDEVAALTVNKVCGSGLKAVMLAAQGIAAGDIETAVAGGMESMSNAPYLLPRVREGLRMGDGTVVDVLIRDGLWCAFENCHMGMSGEVVADTYSVKRCEQDQYAAESHRKAAQATRDGWFRDEILPISIPQKKWSPLIFDRDE